MRTLESPTCSGSPELELSDAFCREQSAILAFSRRASQPSPLPVLLEDSVIIGGDALRVDLGLVATVAEETIQANLILPEARDGAGEPVAASFTYSIGDSSLVACALRTAEPAVTTNLAADDRFHDPALVRLGVVGALVLPLYVNAHPTGAIGYFSRIARSWTPQELSFSETIAHLLTAALARKRAEDELRQERDMKSTLLEMVDTIVLTLDQEGRIRHVNPACESVTQFTLDELQDQFFWEKLIVPREVDMVRSVFRGSRNGRIPSEFFGSLLAKDGSSRHVSWSLRAMLSDDVQSVVLLGSDRTDHVATARRLRQMTSVARHAVDAYFGPNPAAPASPAPAGTPRDAAGRPEQATASVERRASPRRPYPYTQMIAPVRGGELPTPDCFAPVEFRDISSHGAAFLLGDPPDFEEFVLTLGRSPVVRRILCRVARVAACEVGGHRRYLVGCRFVRRLH